MRIHVKTVIGTTIVIFVEPSECIADLKQKIESEEDIPRDLQTLSLKPQQPLEDNFLFSEFGVANRVSLFLKVDFYIYVMELTGRKRRYKVPPTEPSINKQITRPSFVMGLQR
ncbi:hypothetical protein MBANPS3_008689 [Mucor bainieri]